VVVGVVIAVSMVAMWVWVFGYHLTGTFIGDVPGRLDDRSWSDGAELICADAQAQLDELPPAHQARSSAERADSVVAATVILEGMVRRLEASAPGGADGERVQEWVTDWETYLGDRTDYAGRIRQDPDARFYVTQSDRDNRQVTEAVDRFANVNGMPDCETPGDLA
jgi:hypothetical protein